MILLLALTSMINFGLIFIFAENIFSTPTGQDGLDLMIVLFIGFLNALFLDMPCIYLLCKYKKYSTINYAKYLVVFSVNFVMPFLVLLSLVIVRG